MNKPWPSSAGAIWEWMNHRQSKMQLYTDKVTVSFFSAHHFFKYNKIDFNFFFISGDIVVRFKIGLNPMMVPQ